MRDPGVPGLDQRHLLRLSQRPGLLLPLQRGRLWPGRPRPLLDRGLHEDKPQGLSGPLQHQDHGQHRRGRRGRDRDRVPPVGRDAVRLLPRQHHQEGVRNGLTLESVKGLILSDLVCFVHIQIENLDILA